MLVEFSMTPVGKEESVSKYVARAVDIVDKSGLPYRLTAMGTIVEGNWDELFALLKRCHRALEKDCSRIKTVIRLDFRKGYRNRITRMVESVERNLDREVRK